MQRSLIQLIGLLNASNQRRLKFAELLSNTEEWMTLTELSQQLDCSTRVLKDDMVHFRKNFTDFEIQASNQGIQLNYHQNKGMKNLYQQILSESPTYQLLEALFIHEGMSIAELAELLFMSSSTLYRLIRQINTEISKHEFKISKNPYHITGNEKNIRYFFYEYFYEKYSFTGWPFDTVDEEDLDNFLTFHIELTQLKNDFAYYNKFKIISVVNLIRYKNKHYVNTEGIKLNYKEAIPDLSPYTDLFQEFERSFDIQYDNHAIAQIFTDYVEDDFFFNYDRLMEKAAENKEIAAEVSMISQTLENLSEETNISIPNKKKMISAFRNIIHLDYLEPRPGYTLYNRDKYFVAGIKDEFPNFYQTLYQTMKELREFLDKPLTEEGINFYIYTVFTYWKGLVPELRKKFLKIRVTIISDRHVTHAKMLKDFITHEFSEQIVIDIYTGIELDREILENLESDIIVTTFLVPKLTNQRTLYIDSVPIFKVFVNLQKVIDEIIEERVQRSRNL